MTLNKWITLNDGNLFPIIGLGTFRIKGTPLIYDVLDAGLGNGYKSFDTAAVYQNEKDIGLALKKLLPKYKLARKDISLTTKLSPADQGHGKVRAAVQESLQKLNTSYIDLYLIHWPGVSGISVDSSKNHLARQESWKQMVELKHEGVLKSIGVSNYTVKHMTELLNDCYGVKPAVNQVEYHPHFKQVELLKYCREHNILLQAYCSLGGSSINLLNDKVVQSVARGLNKTEAQVLLRWAIQQDIAVIPKSVSPERIKENIDLDFVLDEECMRVIDRIRVKEKFAWNPDTVV